MARSVWLEFKRRAMACDFEVLLHPGHPEHGPEAAVHALELVDSLEQLLSIYVPTSDFSRLNARAFQTPVHVSQPAFELIQLAKEIYTDTSGAFDMTAAKLSEVWGFSSRRGSMPSEQAIAEALAGIGTDAIELDEQDHSIRFCRPVNVNPGGIGKGYALDLAAQSLLERGVTEFAIHGGKSSVRAHGRQLLGHQAIGWKIAVRHPEQTQRILGRLLLQDQALGTSGPANQFFYFRGVRYGHIIDPRTGWPAQGPLSVTVLHPSAAWADALATGLYVMGIDCAVRYCETHPQVGMLAILPGAKQGDVEVVTCNLNDTVWRVAQEDDDEDAW